MTVQEIVEQLKATFGEKVGELSETLDPFLTLKAEDLLEIAGFLKDTAGLEMDFLQDETAVDYPDESLIRMVYHLFSYQHRHGIVLKVELDRAAPKVPTLEGLWPVANWLEREVWDLFGVDFEGHSDLRRIMLPDDWEGHPLRKDYEDPTEYHGISHDRPSPIDGFTRVDEKLRQIAAETAAQLAAATGEGESSEESAS
ncbi:MAG: NADH-quinone oxidoreductase subunit C [Deltaproteobacteria bacterium]|nr:NADH-quinone oxidoreductase subunit C [Deltaproteobacteria bacterium]